MQIIDNINNTSAFFTLTEGDIFRDADGVLMMKVTAIDGADGHIYNCVSLSGACPYSIDANERVTKIGKAVLTLG